MAYYYSASERAFFSSDIVSTGSMPADKVAVTNEQYQQLMADQVSGMLIRPGAGNSPESASQNLSAANRFGNVSFGTVTATGLDLNGNADISGTLVVGGATTLKGALAAQAGITTTTITATGTTTLAALNATNITASGTLKVNGQSTLAAVSATNVSASGTLTVNGNSTLKALSATNISASGTLKVTGASTLTGKLTANGGLDTKAITATTLTTSGNATIGGLLAVTGSLAVDTYITAKGDITANSWNGFRLVDPRHDALSKPSSELQDWPIRMIDGGGHAMAMLKYVRKASGESQWLLADVTYIQSGSDVTQDWAQVTLGHRANGDQFFETAVPFAAKGGMTVSGGDFTVQSAAKFTNGVSVTGSLSLTGSVRADGNVTAGGVMQAGRFDTTGSTGNVIRTNMKGLTKGQNPSTQQVAYWGIYDEHGVGGAANQIGAFSCAYNTDGGTSIRISSYKSDPSAQTANTFTIGWTASGNKYTTAQGDFTADTIKSNANLEVADDATIDGDLSVDGKITAKNTFNAIGSTGFELVRSDIDLTKNPSGDIQSWFLRLKDVENRSALLLKHYQKANGETSVVLSDINYLGGSDDWASITVGHRSDGSRYVLASYDAPDSANGYEIVTAKWLRAYNWDASRGQIVHTVNNETIDGVKTFSRSISVSANPMIQSTNWSGISIADTSRSGTSNKMLAQVLDKDGLRFMGIEVSANEDGGRSIAFNCRNRENTSWVTLMRWMEYADGRLNITTGQHPPENDDSLKVATTGWVNDHLGAAVPAGAICYFAQKSIPSGWLLCNGSNVSRTTYARLFAAIGTSWGSGDGSTTFKLPNLHAKFAQGTTTMSEVGQSVEAGLPNITGEIGYDNNVGHLVGAFYAASGSLEGNASGNGGQVAGFDASRVSSVYGASSTVQPPAVKLLPCIKF